MGDRKLIKEAAELKKVLWKRRTVVKRAIKRSELKEARALRTLQRSIRYRGLKQRERDLQKKVWKLKDRLGVVNEAMDSLEQEVFDRFEGRWVGISTEEDLSRYILFLRNVKGLLKRGYLDEVEKNMAEIRAIVEGKGKEGLNGS